MEFEWNDYKARTNQEKHRVDFADTVSVLEDELAMTVPDPYAEEERSVTIGLDSLGRVLVVIYTVRNNTVRIISARKATPSEIRQYHAQHWRTSRQT